MKANTKSLIILFLLLFSLLFSSASEIEENNTVTNNGNTSLNQVGGPVISNIATNPLYPGLNQDITVTASVEDSDTVDHAQLYWKYESINTTFNTAPMSLGSSTPITGETFSVATAANAIIDDGRINVDWHFGNYTLIDTVMSDISITLDRANADNDLVYYEVYVVNAVSDLWELHETGGVKGGTVDLVNPVSIGITGPINGIKIYAEDHETKFNKQKVPDLVLDFTDASIQATGTIPGIDTPTFVSYYIEANDTLGNLATSPVQSLLIDSVPVFQSVSLPSIITSIDNVVSINVTVEDADGYATLGDVNLFYKLVSEITWNSVSLVFSRNTSLIEAIYLGEFAYTPVVNIESTLDIMINATDTLGALVGQTVSFMTTIDVDFKGPTIAGITIFNSVQNYTSPLENVTMDVEFTDISGVQNATIFFKKDTGGNYSELIMQNETTTSIAITNSIYNITLPAANEDAAISYYFVVYDYYNNSNTTPLNYYYADGLGPVIYENSIIFDAVISNSSSSTIVFNSTDEVGIDMGNSKVYYSTDGGVTWSTTNIGTINYNQETPIYQDVFKSQDTPLFVKDGGFSNTTLEVSRRSSIQIANLQVDFTHEDSTDLRLWIEVAGIQYLIFDREANRNSVSLDLMTLGLSQTDFDLNNFTLDVQDINIGKIGTIDKYEIELISFAIPYYYEYIASIPAAINDTRVDFYISMADIFGNLANSTTLSYYSDALAPVITLNVLTSTLDLQASPTFRISGTIIDNGGVQSAEAYYKFLDGSWQIGRMVLEDSTYFYDAPLLNSTGNITYYIRAFDFVGNQNTSEVGSTLFINGAGPVITILNDLPSGETPLDMEGEGILTIHAEITDNREVVAATLHYKFEADDDWKDVNMTRVNETSEYIGDIDLKSSSGSVIFKVSAEDDEALINETDDITVFYENAQGSFGTIALWVGGIVLAGGASYAAVTTLKKKGKIPR